MMRSPQRRWALVLGAGSLLAAACSEMLTAPAARSGDITTNAAIASDVQAMLSDEMSGWWRAAHHAVPGAALSVAADAHTSSWRNWGMFDVSREPRHADLAALDAEYGLLSTPWAELNKTLIAARDVMSALNAGVDLGSDSDTRRAIVFTKFVQGLTMGTLAELFHQAFILDESVDPGTVQLSPYPQVMKAALMKLSEAESLSSGQTFTIPAAWVGFDRDLDRDGFVRLVRSERARLAISVARTPAERQAVDWSTVLTDARNGITQDWGGRYDGDYEHNWTWSMDKLFAGVDPLWGRLDYRMIGPADASGAYQRWLAAAPTDRRPFLIDTDDRRITGGEPAVDGTLVRYAGNPIFRADRGYDHFSFYADRRWLGLLNAWDEGFNPDFPVEELSFIEAEALYRTGDRRGAMDIVNRTRVPAGLPPLTDPNGVAPGGTRCVPQRADGSCGDLWDAFVYEKRIELFHYGPFTEFVDRRGWGDLVSGTFLDFPAPDTSLGSVLESLFALSSQSAASLANDMSAIGLHTKLAAYQAFDASHTSNPGDVAGS